MGRDLSRRLHVKVDVRDFTSGTADAVAVNDAQTRKIEELEKTLATVAYMTPAP